MIGVPRSTFTLVLAAILPCSTAAQRPAPTPVTPRGWGRYPAIRRIRTLTAAIDAAHVLGRMTTQADSAECAEESVRVVAHLSTDSSGHVRKDVRENGSADSTAVVRYYYDTHGRLRFTFESLGAVNGTKRETRIYFDTTGAQVYKDVRLLQGPGYPRGVDPVVSDPAADSRSPCASPYP